MLICSRKLPPLDTMWLTPSSTNEDSWWGETSEYKLAMSEKQIGCVWLSRSTESPKRWCSSYDFTAHSTSRTISFRNASSDGSLLAYCSRCFKTRKLISMHRWSSETLYCYRRLFLPSRLESSRIMCEKTSQIRGSVHSGLVVKPSLWSSFCTCQPNPPKLSSLSQWCYWMLVANRFKRCERSRLVILELFGSFDPSIIFSRRGRMNTVFFGTWDAPSGMLIL